jgi:two-component system sensor histidine kinase PilS (NtrC family)
MTTEASQYNKQISNVASIYNMYRVILPTILLITYVSNSGTGILGILAPTLFVQSNIFYLIFGIVALLLNRNRESLASTNSYKVITLLIDVFIITLIVFTSGGVLSGLALLLLVSIAFASIVLRGRVSTFIAAIASLAVLYCEFYLSLSLDEYTNQFLQAGILGLILFGSSLSIQSVNNRAYQAAVMADEQASSIVDLEKLNNEIIHRMRTGIIVVNRNNEVISINSAAQDLLSTILEVEIVNGKELFILPALLQSQIENWRANQLDLGEPLEIPNSPVRLQTNFAYLDQEDDADILIFLENQLRMMQRIRQTKLASLGRLTANIAHEVRNPLGAISHAGQILNESESIADEDRRLIDIILTHSDRVSRIIQDVLDASRHKDLAPTSINLKPWLEQFVDHYKKSNENCDEISLSIQPSDIELKVIPGQLERVLTNLFDNGLRYSKKACGEATLKIDVGLQSSEKEGTMSPYIKVIDQGHGLSEEDETQLFEPFHTTESSGTGLGLYISKELCEANHATLEYSVTNAGTSCFSIFFSQSQPATS